MSITEPAKITTPWASTGSKKPIPANANNTTGAAGFDKGFPDITMTPEEAGGLPPAGQDFNGIFYQITDIIRYIQAGGQPTFSSGMSTAIGGYPKGAVILGSDGITLWQSQVESNASNPDLPGSAWSKIDVGLRKFLSDLNGAVYVTDPQFAGGAKGDGVANDAPAFAAALATGKAVIVPTPNVHYRHVGSMILNGSVMFSEARIPEYYGSSTATTAQIVFEGVSSGSDAILQKETLSYIKGIWFKQKDWSGGAAFNGLRMERAIYAEDCLFTNFNGYGQYAHSPGVAPNQPYFSVFNRCRFQFNAKHGAAVFNGANAITYRDCIGQWNGAPSYGAAPVVAGQWDGLHIDGKSPLFPPGGTAFEPQAVMVVGGDWSYNSRYGQNWSRVFDSVLSGGYIENNLVSDIRFGQMYGCQILNPLCQQAPVFNVVRQDPNTPSMNLAVYPNFIWINGIFYGNGEKEPGSDSHGYRQRMPALYTQGSTSELRMYATATGALAIESSGIQGMNLGGSVVLQAPAWRLGGSFNINSPDNYMIAPGGSENSPYFYAITGNQFGELRRADGGGASTAAAFLLAPKNSTTNRSINAGGTVNASGADYAEYMRKSEGCGDIKKGDICGIDSDGMLTDRWERAVSFVVKSTDPSYVGGDSWSSGITTPDPLCYKLELGPDASESDSQLAEEEYAIALDKYEREMEAYERALESARQQVDRIAFAGQVPCNVMGARAGYYICPTPTDSGGITGTAVANPTFEQYAQAVGKVWKVMEDGRAWVAVKIG